LRKSHFNTPTDNSSLQITSDQAITLWALETASEIAFADWLDAEATEVFLQTQFDCREAGSDEYDQGDPHNMEWLPLSEPLGGEVGDLV
jgi:hypothetical protein